MLLLNLNDKRTIKIDNQNFVKIEKNIINKKKEEKLSIFSDAHYLNLEKKLYIEINE